MGLAVYNSVVLEVRLPVVAYKKLLVHNGDSFEPSLSDLAELDGDLAKGLRQLLAFDGDVENIFCRTFEDDDPAGLQAVWKATSLHAIEPTRPRRCCTRGARNLISTQATGLDGRVDSERRFHKRDEREPGGLR